MDNISKICIRRRKMKIKLTLLIISLFISTQISLVGGSHIIVDNADTVWDTTPESSSGLMDVASDVTPRIVADNANSLSGFNLQYSENLDQVASEVSSRIIVEYANSISNFGLYKPNFIQGDLSDEDIPPYQNTVTGALDEYLLELIEKYADSYHKSEWNINIDQYKAWIATIARAESYKGGYVAHSQKDLGNDVFNHKNSLVGSKFRFSTGIGPFQLDRRSIDEWGNWATIEKLNPEKSVQSTMKIHYNNDKFGTGTTLEDFARNSRWIAVNPNYDSGDPAGHWFYTTGTSWDTHKNGKATLNWNDIKRQLSENANHPDFFYENNMKSIGMVKWNIKEDDGIQTDRQEKENSKELVVFDGFYATWHITARDWSGIELFKYYYTYDSNKNIEVWVWDNSNDLENKYKYIFVREYSNCGFSECYFPEHREGNVAGETLEHAALDPSKKQEAEGEGTTPGFEIILVLIALVIFLFWRKKR